MNINHEMRQAESYLFSRNHFISGFGINLEGRLNIELTLNNFPNGEINVCVWDIEVSIKARGVYKSSHMRENLAPLEKLQCITAPHWRPLHLFMMSESLSYIYSIHLSFFLYLDRTKQLSLPAHT